MAIAKQQNNLHGPVSLLSLFRGESVSAFQTEVFSPFPDLSNLLSHIPPPLVVLTHKMSVDPVLIMEDMDKWLGECPSPFLLIAAIIVAQLSLFFLFRSKTGADPKRRKVRVNRR